MNVCTLLDMLDMSDAADMAEPGAWASACVVQGFLALSGCLMRLTRLVHKADYCTHCCT